MDNSPAGSEFDMRFKWDRPCKVVATENFVKYKDEAFNKYCIHYSGDGMSASPTVK